MSEIVPPPLPKPSAATGWVIEFDVDYVEADYAEFQRTATRQLVRISWQFRLILIAVMFAILVGILLGLMLLIMPNVAPAAAPSAPWSRIWPLAAIFIVVYLALLLFLRRWRKRLARRIFTKAGPMQRRHHFAFRADGVSDTEPLASHRFDWLAFVRFVESQTLFQLYVGEALAILIPKRSLPADLTPEGFRHLLSSHITSDPQARVAFPVVREPGKNALV